MSFRYELRRLFFTPQRRRLQARQ